MKKYLCSAALTLVFCSGIAIAKPHNNPTMLYVQTGQTGILTVNKLTLNKVGKNTLWFSAKAGRKAGVISTAVFINHWNNKKGQFSLKFMPPHAAVVDKNTQDKTLHNIDTSLFTLSNPVYDEEKQRVTYQVQYAHQADMPAAAIPLHEATVFIEQTDAS